MTAHLRVGVIPMPNFTMMALAGFLDALRLAADEGDLSRPIQCSWTVMSENRQPVRASNGLVVQPTAGLLDPTPFDYVVVVGGILHAGAHETRSLLAYLNDVEASGTPLVGLCTGVFTLARAGLMKNRRACVNWFHHDDYAAEFPSHVMVSDQLFLDDGDRITCAGGISVLDLAGHLIERHCGPGSAEKGMRIMLEDVVRPGGAPQPAPIFALRPRADSRVQRALLVMERRLAEPLSLADLAKFAGSTPRNLSRLFRRELGCSPAAGLERMRLTRARSQIAQSRRPLAEIAAECGFCDAPHLVRRYRRAYGETPGATRRAASSGA